MHCKDYCRCHRVITAAETHETNCLQNRDKTPVTLAASTHSIGASRRLLLGCNGPHLWRKFDESVLETSAVRRHCCIPRNRHRAQSRKECRSQCLAQHF